MLAGPTASGKSQLLHQLESLQPDRVEIISADSMQVYRGMDIGTAKPGPTERLSPPHHLIDVRDPCQTWDAGEFRREALRLIPQIVARGRVPVISGGTAFYIEALLFGLPQTPPADPEIRSQVAAHIKRIGAQAAWRELMDADPQYASRVGPGDPYRIARGLEILRASGQPPSTFRVAADRPPQLPARLVAISLPRKELYLRITERVSRMLAAGFRNEVRSLLDSGLQPDCPGMRAIGYREIVAEPDADDSVLAQRIATATRRYAKRQLTFLRRLPGVRMLSPQDALTEITSAVDAFHAARGAMEQRTFPHREGAT